MTSKQRAYLRSLANGIDPIFQVGKAGVTPELTAAIDDALEARELIKIQILQNCLEDPKVIMSKLSERTHSEPVQQIGKRLVLYRPSKDKPKIQLSK
ncbi:MAG: ribosome assembly RNA-binding protein YhbY [Epulopiscium sp.]|nr:ribosome assembly RNA-binding protein YhbY [Candidatus Epulonipiscium sp.]